MYIIPQFLANEIARNESFYYEFTHILFLAETDYDAEQLEVQLRKEIEVRSTYNVARAVIMFLPLIAEHQAISNYIVSTKQYDLRVVLPQLVSINEVIVHAANEMKISTREQLMLRAELERILFSMKRHT